MTSTRSIFPVIDTVILLVLNRGVDPVRCFRGPLHRPQSATRAAQRPRAMPAVASRQTARPSKLADRSPPACSLLPDVLCVLKGCVISPFGNDGNLGVATEPE